VPPGSYEQLSTTTEHDKPEMDEEAFDKMMDKKMIKVHKSNQQDDFQVYDGLGEIVLQCQWNIAHM
jgi:hypothetical protein